MRHLSGTGAGIGIAIGAARLLPPRLHVEQRTIAAEHVAAELGRFTAAVTTADAAMAALADVRIRTGGPDGVDTAEISAEFIEVHRSILRSDEVEGAARRLIRDRRVGAEWAVRMVLEQLRGVFARVPDDRYRARFDDVEAVTDRLLRSLLELPEIRRDERLTGAIGIGRELSPLDALLLHRLGVAGFATEGGGPSSHGAILARALGLPYVFGVRGLLAAVRAGDRIGIDGTRGEVVLSPDDAAAQALETRRVHASERRKQVAATPLEPLHTLDGVRIAAGANVRSVAEVTAAVAAGADHIGLVRTELLYLERLTLPGEDEQLRDAVELIGAAGGRPVTFRTLDLGGDKLPEGLRSAGGPNPALGLRGIRCSLRRRDLFKPQLRALFRASAAGPVRILLPFVSSVSEIREAREVCQQVCAELTAEGLPFDPHTPLGAMIETPSAVLTADHIAAACDFVSIGTNDLIQYAFAADRQSAALSHLYQPLHPSILRSLQRVVAAAAQTGCAVSVCGDMAGDPAYACVLLGLGLRSLSMTACELPRVRSLVRRTRLADAEALTQEALRLSGVQDIEALVLGRLGEAFAGELAGRCGGRPRPSP